MRVVHVGPDRIEHINRLRVMVGWEAWPASDAAVIEAYLTTLGAFDDGGLVGWCGALRSSPDRALLVDLAVAEEARRRGLGGRMVEATLDELRALGIGQAALETSATLAPWFERRGFTYESVGHTHGFVRLFRQL